MLVIPRAKRLALKLNKAERVVSNIPSARSIEVRGQRLTIVPHNLDEVRVLNNLGIRAPSPILHYYDWPGRFKPYLHQKQTAAFLTLHPKSIVLNEIGTGKTQSALWAADYLMNEGVVKKVLILSPLSTLERVWGDAIFTSFPNRNFVTLHGDAARRNRLLKQDVDFYILNHDGFKVIADKMEGMFDLIIVDEAAVYRNPSSHRFRMFRGWLRRNPQAKVWLMTGTPTPNEPTDAWALARLIDSPNCDMTYTAFREQVMHKIRQHTWVARPGAIETVRTLLQPAIRYTRDECFDLPATVVQTRQVPLTPEQNKHYTTMVRHFITQASMEETITAVNEAVKLQKLVQIACGVAYADDGSHVELDCAPRVNLVKELIEEAGGKVIVFVPLTGTLHMLERELSKHWTVGVVNGAVSSAKRNEIFKGFQHGLEPEVLVAHPATMAHGLTLTAASTVIWYGPVTSNEQYVQANGRIERIGKHHVSNVIHIQATSLESQMYDRLHKKQKLQGLLLDLIREHQK
jgi:SNF2 family DNA or RNA helicase